MILPKNVTSDIWLLSWATFLNRSTGFLALFAAIFFKSSGFEEKRIVAALFLCGVAGVVSSTISGVIADRVGAKRVLISATILNVPITLGLAFASSPFPIIALAAASVFLSQSFIPPASSIIALSAEGADRVSMFAFYRIFINVGSIVAPAIVGFVGTDHFRVLFLFSSTGYVVTALILSIFHPASKSLLEDDKEGNREEKGENEIKNPATLHLSLLWVVFVSMGVAMAVYAQHQGAVPLSMNARENGDRIFSSLLILNPVLIVFLEYPLSYLTKRLHWSTALALGTAIMGVGVAITGAFPPVVFAYIGWVMFSLGECIFAPMSNTAVAELSSTENTSKNQGLLSSFQSAGMALGPAAGTAMFFISSSSLWVGIAIVSVVIAVVVLLTGRKARSHSGESLTI